MYPRKAVSHEPAGIHHITQQADCCVDRVFGVQKRQSYGEVLQPHNYLKANRHHTSNGDTGPDFRPLRDQVSKSKVCTQNHNHNSDYGETKKHIFEYFGSFTEYRTYDDEIGILRPDCSILWAEES